MKYLLSAACCCLLLTTGFCQQIKLAPLKVGEALPAGWMKKQMQQDIAGFAGNLDALVPNLFTDDIYGKERIGHKSKLKDLGNSKEGDAGGDEQYMWWNSETQSNWWDGYIRNAFMLKDSMAIKKTQQYIQHILATQDADGYLGIYDTTLRYHFTSENGELWSKATLYRGLLAYYELSGDEAVLNAMQKAAANVMKHYPVNQSSPFESGTNYNGGVSHGLMFTDVLYKLFLLTKQASYLDYAVFLYNDYSRTTQSEKDAQAANIKDKNYKLQSHGVHSYEHLRSIITAALSANGKEAKALLPLYLNKINPLVTVTGGAIGDEWIGGRNADETNTGYEYCSLQELMDGYAMLLQATGEAKYGDAIERIFYNAAQGSRHPEKSCIAYLKTDNSFTMDGTRNGEAEKDRKQTRYKYSPAHQDVAVCCAPNAGRITPYFVQNSWLRKDEQTLVLALLGPTILNTTINGSKVSVVVKTNYPYNNDFNLILTADKPVTFSLMVRKPEWVTTLSSNINYRESKGWCTFQVATNKVKTITLKLGAALQTRTTQSGEKYFTYGALVYALPIAANETAGKDYGKGMKDLFYTPVNNSRYQWMNKPAVYANNTIKTTLYNMSKHANEQVTLIPLAKTILRQVSFGVKQ